MLVPETWAKQVSGAGIAFSWMPVVIDQLQISSSHIAEPIAEEAQWSTPAQSIGEDSQACWVIELLSSSLDTLKIQGSQKGTNNPQSSLHSELHFKKKKWTGSGIKETMGAHHVWALGRQNSCDQMPSTGNPKPNLHCSKLLKHLVKLKKRLINQGQAIFATHLRPGLRGPDSCWFVNAIIFLMLDSTWDFFSQWTEIKTASEVAW